MTFVIITFFESTNFLNFDRGYFSLCSSLTGLSTTIQLRIDSSYPAQACVWKFHPQLYNLKWIVEWQCEKSLQWLLTFFEDGNKLKLYSVINPSLKPHRKFYKTWTKQWIPVTIFINLPAETLSRKQPFQMTEPECHPFQFSVMNYYRR